MNYLLYCIGLIFFLIGIPALAGNIQIKEIKPPRDVERVALKPDQLPQSRVTHGVRDIAAVWLAGATERYRHGVLGDSLEASRLVVETREGKQIFLDLPENRVFEDLYARLVDLDSDGRDEIVVVESDVNEGASLSVYGLVNNKIILRAKTAFIGQAYRWLNPVGAGDFDGDGKLDLALVATPHIGGVARLYHYDPPALTIFAELDGVSTHRIGSTEIALGQVAPGKLKDRIILPDQGQRALLLLEWVANGIREIARTPLPARIVSSLKSLGDNHFQLELDNGRYYEVHVTE